MGKKEESLPKKLWKGMVRGRKVRGRIMKDQKKRVLDKLAGNMPDFLDQNRPAKVKEIYRALKRDHPDMPAEMKARIASRQGKKGKQKQGPPYKAPITAKYKGKTASKMSLKRREKLPTKSFAVPESKAKKIGVSSEIKGEAKGKYPVPDKAHARNALSRVSAFGTPSEKALVRAKVHAKFPDIGKEKSSSLIALQKRATDLRNDIVNRAMSCGESMEKSAAQQYFHDLRKPVVDAEMLGSKFCKLAHGIGRDPWALALEVADNFPAYAVLSKTASDSRARELAEFYLDWVDEMEKTAFTLPFSAAARMSKAVAGIGAKAAPATKTMVKEVVKKPKFGLGTGLAAGAALGVGGTLAAPHIAKKIRQPAPQGY